MTRLFFLFSFFFTCCVLGGQLCQANPMMVGGAAITTIAKQPYRLGHRYYHRPATQDQAPAVRLTETAKKRPVSVRRHRQSVRAILSPTKLRRKLSARSAIVMDSETGQVIYAHAPDRPAQPASTIKVLTGLIAMKSLRDNTKVKVSRKAARMPRSKIYLRKGKQYVADDLINAVLLSSANDASVALAERVAGTERTFAKLMNYKAKQLGARSTLCKTATGLTSRGQHSTVRDLATIFRVAMHDDEFSQRIGKSRVRTRYGGTLNNHNKALWRIKGAVGGKTGYTHAARQTYVGQFVRGDKEITVAIMGSETMWDDITRLVEHGFARERLLAAAAQQRKEQQTRESTKSRTKAKLALAQVPQIFAEPPASRLSAVYKRAIF